MALQIQSHKAELKFPQLSVFMGSPKVGKSTMMAKLPKALILDLEGTGYRGLDVKALAKVKNYDDVAEGLKVFFSKDNDKYNSLVIDHLRMLTSFLDKKVSGKHGVEFTADVDFGRGHAELKYRIDTFIKKIIKRLADYPDKRVIFVAHSSDRNGETRLDIDGKNESLVLGLVDAIGYITREEDTTMVSFQTKRGHEFGTRNKHLSNYKGKFDWKTLFDVAKGKIDANDTD